MTEHELVGWEPTPSSRGTLSIIYSCATVLVTATWSLLHLNVPGENDSLVQSSFRKARWGIFAIFAPDLLILVAASQWASARDSVKQMRELNDDNSWTSVHAFYANSGGFILQLQNELIVPVDAQQIHFLVSRSYIPLPTITRDEIWDKSKADWFAKGFALLQTGWIVIQSIARAVNGLSVSPLEVLTLAYISLTLMTYFFWWNKPQDVKTPTVLYCEFSAAKILTESGIPSDAAFTDSPLDFVQDPSRVLGRRTALKDFDLERQTEPDSSNRTRLRRIPNDSVLTTSFPFNVLSALAIPALVHSAVHLLGWNFTYPSRIEQLLWRTSVVVLVSLSVIGIGTIHLLRTFGYQGRYNVAWAWVSYQQEGPHKGIFSNPLDLFFTLLFIFHIAARLYILLEAIMSLRNLPADVFITVSWTNYFPHV